MILKGIFKKQRTHTKMAGGFFSFEEEGTSTKLYGFGHGDHIRLRDELGNVWRGSAERTDDSVRYTFRDPNGRVFYDPEYSEEDDRFILIGLSSTARPLVVVHCYKESDSVIRIIFARKATKKEVRFYEEGI